MHSGPKRPRQPVPRDGRLEPVPYPLAFHVVEQLAPVEHGDRIAERERLYS
ncbi:hypothetical protein D3C72_2440360 [compost metagenome]